MSHLFSVDNIISFFILVILEVILGIDNVIFVSIIMNRLNNKQLMAKARMIWMITGMFSRTALLFGLSWLLSQKGNPILTIGSYKFDLASIVMLAGGVFLIYKSVMEIHEKLEGENPNVDHQKEKGIGLSKAIFQIIIIDAVFSFDSIITAGGTTQLIEIMIAAIVIAMIMMFLFSAYISSFIHRHPTLKMLALSFLVMIGLSLVIEGWDATSAKTLHLKNYIYFGMAFSFGVEMLNMAMRKKQKTTRVVELNEPQLNDDDKSSPLH